MKRNIFVACIGIVYSSLGVAKEPECAHFVKVMTEQHAITLVEGGKEGDGNGLVDFSFPLFEDPLKNHVFPRKGTVQYVIVHYTWEDIERTLRLFSNGKEPRVSAHYYITQKEEGLVPGGIVVQCVPEKDCARHAGVSEFHGAAQKAALETPVTGGGSGLNHLSVGIELVNWGDRHGAFQAFDPDQLQKLGLLCQYLQEKHAIKPTHFIGHADVAFRRKPDPGPLFPWGQLHEEFGIGAWLTEVERADFFQEEPNRDLNGQETERLFSLLKQYGYNLTGDLSERGNALFAFRAHFSCNQEPERCDKGRAPDVNDLLWIEGLVKKYASQEADTAVTEKKGVLLKDETL